MKNIHRDDYPLGDGQSIMTSAEQFFTYGVLKTRPDNDITDGLGLPDPTLLGALAVTWIILYFSLRGGVGGQGKVGNQVLPTVLAVNLHHHIEVKDQITSSFRLLTSQPSSPTWSFSLFLSEDSHFLALKKVFYFLKFSKSSLLISLSKASSSSSHQSGRS